MQLFKYSIVSILFSYKNFTKYKCESLNFDGPDISSSKFKQTLDLNLLPETIHDILWLNPYYYELKLKTLMSEPIAIKSLSKLSLVSGR